MENSNSKSLEHNIYWISIWTLLSIGLIYLIQITLLYSTNQLNLMECILYKYVGIPCPGCGGTRAIKALFTGNLLESIRQNAFVTYTCIVYGIFFVTQTLQRITKEKIKGVKFRNVYLWIGIVILTIQYIFKLANI